jgi:hypothetical protein
MCLQLPSVRAAGIYRWVDESGRTQLSDVVPEKYKSTAQRIETKQFELSATQRADAAARAERERAQAQAATTRPKPDAQPPAPSATASAAAPRAGTECDRLWQEYRAAQECFAPYQRRNSGVAPEAFQKCQTVENPSQRCGPSKW